jgi:hypothetical protein
VLLVSPEESYEGKDNRWSGRSQRYE